MAIMKVRMIMLLKMKMIVQRHIMKMPAIALPGDDGDAIEMYYHLIAPDIFSTSNAKNRSILEWQGMNVSAPHKSWF